MSRSLEIVSFPSSPECSDWGAWFVLLSVFLTFWRCNINRLTGGTHWGRRNHEGPGDSACICSVNKACRKLKYSGSYLFQQVLTKLSSKSKVMYLGPIPSAKLPFTLLHISFFSFLKEACDSLLHTYPENERLFVTSSWTSYLKKGSLSPSTSFAHSSPHLS